MSLRQKYAKRLADALPSLLSLLLLLGSSMPPGGSTETGGEPSPTIPQAGVAERLAAVRDAVSDVAGRVRSPAGEELAWWAWRNGGGGWRNGGGAWRNGGGGWRNGGAAWRNGGGGWRNGGWHNAPWGNFWRNF